MAILLLALAACLTSPASTEIGGGPTDAIPQTVEPADGPYVKHGVPPQTRILWKTKGESRVLVDDGGSPDRPSLSPARTHLAYVSAPNGLAAVFVYDLRSGETTQLTNHDRAHFFDVPLAAPRFDGDELTWTAGGTDHRVRWR